MTNTLTWDIKSIQVPKVNSNLLSVVSLILLLTMAFLTVAVIAICEEEEAAAEAALERLNEAGKELNKAAFRLGLAVLTRIAPLIRLAAKDYLHAWHAFHEAKEDFDEALEEFQECVDSHMGSSGSCNS